MNISKLKVLGGLIALMLIMCLPSFGGIVTDNLGAQTEGVSGTGYGDIAQAQRFLVSENNTVDYTFAFNFLNSGWITGYGSANQMMVNVVDDATVTATLLLSDGPNSDVGGLPTLSIFTDVYNSVFFQPEPGTLVTTFAMDPTSFIGATSGPVSFSATLSSALTEGSYWMVLTSPGPNGAVDAQGNPTSLGVETNWSYTGAPEPATLSLIGGALILLSLGRKRLRK